MSPKENWISPNNNDKEFGSSGSDKADHPVNIPRIDLLLNGYARVRGTLEVTSLPHEYDLCEKAGLSFEVAQRISSLSAGVPQIIDLLIQQNPPTPEAVDEFVKSIGCWSEIYNQTVRNLFQYCNDLDRQSSTDKNQQLESSGRNSNLSIPPEYTYATNPDGLYTLLSPTGENLGTYPDMQAMTEAAVKHTEQLQEPANRSDGGDLSLV